MFATLKTTARTLYQPLLGQHAGLQSSDRSVDPGILLLVVAIREEEDQRSDHKHGNCYQSANAERPPFLIDRALRPRPRLS